MRSSLVRVEVLRHRRTLKASDSAPQPRIAPLRNGRFLRKPMLVAGHVDAVTGLSFSSYINVKYSSVPRDDIVVFLMADYGVSLYGNGIMVSPKFAAEKPD